MFAEGKGRNSDTNKTNILDGKTIWIVDINTNEYFKSTFQAALVDQLKAIAPGATVRHVITSGKGNPFFLIKQDDLPYAAIVSLAVCEGTSKDVANYASEAGKKDIRTVMINITEVREAIAKWNKTYHNATGSVIEIEKMPETQDEAVHMAGKVIPEFIKKLKK